MRPKSPPTPEGCSLDQADCGCHNLSQREVTKRQNLAYSSFVVAFALVGYQKVVAQPDWVQWMPMIPFFVGFLGIFQAKTRTCVALALADKDMTEDKLGPVKDRETGWKLKKRSAKIIAGAAALAFVATAICQRL